MSKFAKKVAKNNVVKVKVTGLPCKQAAIELVPLTLMRFGDELGDCGAYIGYANGVATFTCDGGFEKILVKEIEHLNNRGAKMTYNF